jgi:lipoprotein signal peptidase
VVTGALEIERKEKRIGSSLQAAPVVTLPAADAALLDGLDMAELAITSGIELRAGDGAPPEGGGAFALPDVPGVAVVPAPAPGEKCARCWRVLPEVTPEAGGCAGDAPTRCRAARPERRRTCCDGSPGRPALFVAVLALDQVTKAMALASLDPAAGGGPVAVTPFFNLVLVWNTGVSFGMLAGAGGASPWILVGLALLIAGVVAVWLARERRTLPRVALWLVLAGALGNVIDRVRFGAVVDFLDFHLAGYHWPAFNVADSAIVIGAGLLILDGLLGRQTTTNEEQGSEGDARA